LEFVLFVEGEGGALSGESRVLENRKTSLTKNRGRLKKVNKRNIRVSFRLTYSEYKQLLERCGGKRRLSGFIRKALGVE
jgi:hypothetical protein